MIGKIDGVIKKFEKPACIQCKMSEKWADNNGFVGLHTSNMSQEEVDAHLESNQVDYEVIDISQEADLLSFVTGTLGYSSAPVFYNPATEDHFYGFDTARLNEMFAVSA